MTPEQNAAILNALGVLTDFAGNGMLTSAARMTAIQTGKRLAAAFVSHPKRDEKGCVGYGIVGNIIPFSSGQ